MRADWYANGNLIARTIQRQLLVDRPIVEFRGFPRHWIPLFEWAGASWRHTTEPECYVPLFSGRSERDVIRDIVRARSAHQLRHLVEVAASAEIVLCETLQRIDEKQLRAAPVAGERTQIRLTTWHSYGRSECRAYDALLTAFRPKFPDAVFLPCAKSRPYQRARSHQKLIGQLRAHGIDPDRCDKIVITSMGPVPEEWWDHELVRRYDTGVRDIYRMLIQCRILLRHTHYAHAWDLLSFAPYCDLLGLLHLERIIPMPQRLPGIRRRNIPVYRGSRALRITTA